MPLHVDFSRLDARDVLDVAIQVEQEAEDNYEQLAGWMDAAGNDTAADFFRRMAIWERRHREQIMIRRRDLFGDAPPKYSRNIAWEVETPDYEALGRSPTLAEAFELAMGAEQRAHDYYQGALEYAADERVTELLEWLRKAEIEHQRMLDQEKARLMGS